MVNCRGRLDQTCPGFGRCLGRLGSPRIVWEDPQKQTTRHTIQRDDLLAFAGVLDTKLAGIAHNSKVCIDLVRGACLLQRKSSFSTSGTVKSVLDFLFIFSSRMEHGKGSF